MDSTYTKTLCPYAMRQRDDYRLLCAKRRDARMSNPHCPYVWRCPTDMLLYNSPFSKSCELVMGGGTEPPVVARNVLPSSSAAKDTRAANEQKTAGTGRKSKEDKTSG